MSKARSSLPQDILRGYLAAVVAARHVILQSSLGQFEGYVPEQPVLLGTEVPDHVGVGVGFSQKCHLAVGEIEAARQQPFHRDRSAVEFAPARKNLRAMLVFSSITKK